MVYSKIDRNSRLEGRIGGRPQHSPRGLRRNPGREHQFQTLPRRELGDCLGRRDPRELPCRHPDSDRERPDQGGPLEATLGGGATQRIDRSDDAIFQAEIRAGNSVATAGEPADRGLRCRASVRCMSIVDRDGVDARAIEAAPT